MPIKPLTFKGDKKPKKHKRKHHDLVDEPTQDPDDDDDSWTTPSSTTDLNGPIVLVLPTHPPTCLASDALGNIFASPIENLTDNVIETAEPHDVRQVWVISQVAGTETVSLKASHGMFLGCDAFGVLGARREARGLEEGFTFEDINTEKKRWRLKTFASQKDASGARYLAALAETGEEGKKVSITLRGDGEAGSESTELVVKMQARFLPKLQEGKELKAREKVSRRELEQTVGRRLEDDEVKRLKRAKKDGTFYEEVLDVRVKGKHDKFAN